MFQSQAARRVERVGRSKDLIRTGAKTLPDSGTDLIVKNLLRRTMSFEETEKFDNIRVLVFSARQYGCDRKRSNGLLTRSPYLLVVPSKQRTMTLGLWVVESVDIVEERISEDWETTPGVL